MRATACGGSTVGAADVSGIDRRKRLESLERDKETILNTYAGLAPEALASLDPEERHQLYKMLRLKVAVNLDGTLEIGGDLANSLQACNIELSS